MKSKLKTVVKHGLAFCAVKSGLISIDCRDRTAGRLIILMYHRVNSELDILGLSVSQEFFDRQLDFTVSRFKIITLAEAVSMVSEGIPPGNYAVITFDDGYRDNYDCAFPILKKYRAPATFFVTVDALETGRFGWFSFDSAIFQSVSEKLDLRLFDLPVFDIRTRSKKEKTIKVLHRDLKSGSHERRQAVINHVTGSSAALSSDERIMLNWEEIREMQESGSHTMTHPILTRMNPEAAYDEICRSKTIIEARLGTPIDLFAYPNGTINDFNDELAGMLKRSGYRAACTTVHGIAVQGMDPYMLPRIDVTYGMCQGIGGKFSPEMFEAALLS